MTADQRHVEPTEGSAAAPVPDDRDHDAPDHDPSDTAASLLESAAEIVVGTAIAPFTGGETMPMVASLAEALEGGVDRLTHRSRPVDDGGPAAVDEDEHPT